jgi:hypothetical protein
MSKHVLVNITVAVFVIVCITIVVIGIPGEIALFSIKWRAIMEFWSNLL